MTIRVNHLPELTPELRLEMQQKAAISKQIKKDASVNIQSMVDHGHWRDLASKCNIRLPQAVCQSDELKFVKRAANKLGVDVMIWVKDVVGAKTLKEVAELNPNIGAVGMVGLFLEAYDEGLLIRSVVDEQS